MSILDFFRRMLPVQAAAPEPAPKPLRKQLRKPRAKKAATKKSPARKKK